MRRILAAAAVFLTLLAGAQQPDKVAAVQRGELKEARVSWWGFNAEDATEALTAAINSKVPRLVVDRMASPWITAKTLTLVSNQEIVFEEGAEILAKQGAFHDQGDCLVRLRNVDNVTLRGLGKGAILRMRKADYHTAAYKKSEWRHAVSILSSRNIRLENLTMAESGGDGIYLGVAISGKYDTDIVVKDCVCDGNNRQGISVIAGINVLVENTKLLNTKGTAPEAGIDFEPNRADEPIRNFIMRNCYSENNAGGGYVHYLPNMRTGASPLEITYENCISRNDNRRAFSLHTSNGPGSTMQGQIIVRDCLFENCPESINFVGCSASGFRTTLENVTIRNVATKTSKALMTPLQFGLGARDEEAFGNIVFKQVTVEDNLDRPLFQFNNGGCGCGGMDNVEGSVNHVVNGQTRTVTFTPEWARQTYPPRVFHQVPAVDLKQFTLQPAAPSADARVEFTLPNLIIRHRGNYLLQVAKDENVRFSVGYRQLGKYQATEAPTYLVSPSGKRKKLAPVPFKTEKEYSFTAEEEGFYTVEVNAGTNLSVIRRCSCPVAVEVGDNRPNLCTGTGDFYAAVPAGTPEFSMMFWGDGAEGLHVTVYGPDGNEVWQKDDISGGEQFYADGDLARKGGIFRLKIQKPTNLPVIEDYGMRFSGIPAFLSPSPAHVFNYQRQN